MSTITERTALRSEGRTYQLVKKLGGGGFGEVWRARLVGAAGFSKEVAVKLLHSQADLPAADRKEYEQRLRDEARLLGALKHRAIVFAEDLIEIEGRPALVMEIVEGHDLEGLLRLGPVPPRVMAEIVSEVASALAVAHGAKDPETGRDMELVHRDIKPANIRVGPRGDVKVLDFGIAFASFDRREAKTQSNLFFTQGYYPPERVRLLFETDGEIPPERSTTDIYALGVVIAEGLLGKRAKLSLEVERHEARRKELVASLPDPQLGALVSSMLEEDPAARPTAAAVEDRLVEIAGSLAGPPLRRWAPDAIRRLELMAAETAPAEVGQPRPEPSSPAPAASIPSSNAPSPAASSPSPASTPSGSTPKKGGAGLLVAGGVVGLGGALAAALLVIGIAGYVVWRQAPTDTPPVTATTPTTTATTTTPTTTTPTTTTATTPTTATTATAPATATPGGRRFRVGTTGDAKQVTATNSTGTFPLPGVLTEGSWTITATFANQTSWTGEISVSGPMSLICGSGRAACWSP